METGTEMADIAQFRPKRVATMLPASILMLHVALRERERERERERDKDATTSCALTSKGSKLSS